MNTRRCLLLCLASLVGVTTAAAEDLPPIPPIQRVLPPEGLEFPAEVRQRLETRLAATKKRLETMRRAALGDLDLSDVEIFTKAVELALIHREFYVVKDFEKADWALDEASKRLDVWERKDDPEFDKMRLCVRGYRSEIDGSAQPYGVVLPENFSRDKGNLYTAYVWLHGRGDKNTDLHFLYERSTKVGQIAPPGAIVLHPFGRHCVGWKHAGEIDVLEMVLRAELDYPIAQDSVVLAGFSMGGAGAWHLGAHHTDEWVAVSPGAGFAETARYQNLTPDRFPPSYEQTLWGMYDVPGYVRNLFNVPVIAYSGENDKQIQAARIMEEAYAAEGEKLPHLIGPGVEHKYEPKTLELLLEKLQAAASSPNRNGYPNRASELAYEKPKKVRVQTKTLQYNRMYWVWLDSLREHWQDSRVDAEIVGNKSVRLTTKNVAALRLGPWKGIDKLEVAIDGQSIDGVPATSKQGLQLIWLSRGDDGQWTSRPLVEHLRKRHWLQGPIDHAFMSEFLVVVPTGRSRNPAFQAWCDFELAHFKSRWRALMRADLPVKRDVDVVAIDWKQGVNLILWGDVNSNALIKQFADRLPVKFGETTWTFGHVTYDANRFAPVLIFPNVLQTDTPRGRRAPFEVSRGYIVLNSGLTFREGHDRTNSLQNPKLPDWAIIDMTQPPDAFAPGRIHDAGFFDEKWQLKGQPKGP